MVKATDTFRSMQKVVEKPERFCIGFALVFTVKNDIR